MYKRQGLGGDAAEIEALAPRVNGLGHLLGIGGGQDEYHVARRLLQRCLLYTSEPFIGAGNRHRLGDGAARELIDVDFHAQLCLLYTSKPCEITPKRHKVARSVNKARECPDAAHQRGGGEHHDESDELVFCSFVHRSPLSSFPKH